MRSGPLLYPKPQNEQDWESWCRLIFARVLGVSHFQKFETRGKSQKGIDVLGCREDGTYVSVQAKLRNTATPLKQTEAEAEVKKAKTLKCKITDLVFATTHDSKGLQEWAARVTTEHAKTGLFKVAVYAWPDICELLNEHEDIARDLRLMLPSGPPTNVPRPSVNVVSRPEITAEIHDVLKDATGPGAVRQAAANAYGGYGKTVAALLYADEYADFYTGGRFFLSMEQADFVTHLASLGAYLGVPPEAKPDQAAPLVKRALESGDPALLILDNVADAEQWQAVAVTGLLPGVPCRVLVTTRAESIPQATMVQIGRLSHEQARAVYAKFCAAAGGSADKARPAPDAATADAITDWLEGLAVAVAAVGARMKLRPDLDWADYANHLRGLALEDLPCADPAVLANLGADTKGLEEHRRTLHVIDDAIGALPTPERRAVEYAALLPADLVPGPWLEELLNADAAGSDAGRPDGGEPSKITFAAVPDDPTDAARAVLRHLERLDVLRPAGAEKRILSLHRLWRQRLHERAAEGQDGQAALWSAIAACAMGRMDAIVGRDVNDPAALTDQALRWELVPLAALCRTLWDVGRPGDAAAVGVWLAGVLRLLGRFAEAAACLSPVADHEAAVEKTIGHETLAAGYSNLAMILLDLGDLPEARRRMERAIEIDEEHFDPDHPNLAIRYSNLAMILQALGDLPAAQRRMERAIEVWEKHFDRDHPTLATSYSNLATILQDLGDLPEARRRMERAIEIDEKHFDPDHPILATRYHNLASIAFDQSKRSEALALEERALSILRKHLDEDHPHVKISRKSLARYRSAVE